MCVCVCGGGGGDVYPRALSPPINSYKPIKDIWECRGYKVQIGRG